MIKIPSYLGGPKFDSWSRDPPSFFSDFCDFHYFVLENAEMASKLGYDWFRILLSSYFTFIFPLQSICGCEYAAGTLSLHKSRNKLNLLCHGATAKFRTVQSLVREAGQRLDREDSPSYGLYRHKTTQQTQGPTRMFEVKLKPSTPDVRWLRVNINVDHRNFGMSYTFGEFAQDVAKIPIVPLSCLFLRLFACDKSRTTEQNFMKWFQDSAAT